MALVLGHSNTPLIKCLVMTMLTPPAKQGKLGCEDAGVKPKALWGGRDNKRDRET